MLARSAHFEGNLAMLGSEDDYHTAMHRIRSAISDEKYGDLISLDGLKIYEIPSLISDARRVREVDLNNSSVERIDVLGEMPWLKCIRLSNTNVYDLSVVGRIHGLVASNEVGVGVYFRNTKVKDQNVINISLIDDVAVRTRLLYDYYRYKNDSDVIGKEIHGLGDLPEAELGVNFEPDEKYRFKTSITGTLSEKDVAEIGDLREICRVTAASIIDQTSTSNQFSRLNQLSRLYLAELSKIDNEISIDKIWAYGGGMCGYEKIVDSISGEAARDFNEQYVDLRPLLLDFKTFHGALVLSTGRGKSLNQRSFELIKDMNVDEYAEVVQLFTSSINQSRLLTDEARSVVEQINDAASIRASRMGAHSSSAASNNLILALAKTIVVWAASGYVGNLAYTAIAPENLKMIAIYLVQNAALISHVVGASGANPAWVSAFIEWIQRHLRL